MQSFGKNKIEILAPAGDEESFFAAIDAGADSIFVGLDKFSARAKAQNFTIEKLEPLIEHAHILGVKVFAALNTIVKDKEILEAVEMVDKLQKIGVDAIILQDLSLLFSIKKAGINIALHASTQLGCCNLEGAKFLEKLGFTRVILARETLLEDIIKISSGTSLELEFFIQGALCVAYSGNCYFSSLIMGESGNRGRCLQPCRKKYDLKSGEEIIGSGYLLSAKDLSLASEFSSLVKAGITSFKIEGRMRKSDFVYEATKYFVQVKNNFLQGNKNLPCDRALKIAFNRGDYCGGYLNKNAQHNIIYSKHGGHKGLEVGRVKAILANKVLVNGYTINLGDGIKIMRCGEEVEQAKIGDSVHLTRRKREEVVPKKIRVSAKVNFSIGSLASVSLSTSSESVTICSKSKVQPAIKSAITPDNIRILGKMSDKTLEIVDFSYHLDENCFLPLFEIKQMRREARAKLKQQLAATPSFSRVYDKLSLTDTYPTINFLKFEKKQLFLMSDSIPEKKQLDLCDYYIFKPKEYTLAAIKEFASVANKKGILDLPLVLRGKDIDIIQDIIQNSNLEIFIINNISHFEMLKGKSAILGQGLNIFNSYLLEDALCIASLEATAPRKNAINQIYGRVPLMHFSHCVSSKKDLSLIDKTHNARFPIRYQKIANCYHTLYNSVPLDNREALLESDCSFLIDLTDKNILESLEVEKHSDKPHTHGNYKKTIL